MRFYGTFLEASNVFLNHSRAPAAKMERSGAGAQGPTLSRSPTRGHKDPRAWPARPGSEQTRAARRAAPRHRAAPSLARPSHSQLDARRSSAGDCTYLAPLLRKPRTVRQAAPGAPQGRAALPPTAGTRPKRPRSNEKLRTGIVTVTYPRLPNGSSTSRCMGPRSCRPGSAPTPPGPAESSSHQQRVPGRHAGRGQELSSRPGGGAGTQAPVWAPCAEVRPGDWGLTV